MELVKYDAACRAVAMARTIDEVKEISNRAEAARAYAKQAKNRTMEMDAIEIRVRAERRLGEIILEMRSNKVVTQGNQPPEPHKRRATLSEFGIDGQMSAKAQRLALLPSQRFESEIADWRERTPKQHRVETPLQSFRHPSVAADRAKVRLQNGRVVLSEDKFDKFRGPDGRLVVDWRAGELKRIAAMALRTLRAAEALQHEMPCANPEVFATMEMIYEAGVLAEILERVWKEFPLANSDAGLEGVRLQQASAAYDARKRSCEQCTKEFVMHRPSGKARAGKSNEGRFCSRECANVWRRSNEHGTSAFECAS